MVDSDLVISVSLWTVIAALIVILLYPIIRAPSRESAAIVSMSAHVVGKRARTGGLFFHIVSTDYYVTSQLDTGTRRESRVTGHTHGALAAATTNFECFIPRMARKTRRGFAVRKS